MVMSIAVKVGKLTFSDFLTVLKKREAAHAASLFCYYILFHTEFTEDTEFLVIVLFVSHDVHRLHRGVLNYYFACFRSCFNVIF